MKIWIHINGVQEGPFEPENLPLNRMDPKTPVWYEGLDYWMPASAAPVTADLLRAYYAGEISAYGRQPQPTDRQDDTVDVDMPEQSATNIDVATGQAGQASGSTYARQETSQKYSAYAGYSADRRSSWQQPQECPPTYLVWSIVLTLLCCNPIGIISAVMGWTVTSKFRENDFEGARRRSETTAWWFIITIVTSLIFTPMYMLVSM